MTGIVEIPAEMIRVSDRSFRLLPMSISSQGMFDGEISVHGPIRKRWIAKATWVPQGESAWREWDGLLASLDGMVGRVRIYDPMRRNLRYNDLVAESTSTFDDGATFDDGSLWSNGAMPPRCVIGENASRGATDLLFTNLPASIAAGFGRGDVFEIQQNGIPQEYSQFHIITRRANTNAAGETRVSFSPGLRANVKSGDTIVTKDARCLMRLASDDEGEINVDAAHHGRFGLSLSEILPRL